MNRKRIIPLELRALVHWWSNLNPNSAIHRPATAINYANARKPVPQFGNVPLSLPGFGIGHKSDGLPFAHGFLANMPDPFILVFVGKVFIYHGLSFASTARQSA